MENKNVPDFSGLSGELVNEWHRVQGELKNLGLIHGEEYPQIQSARRNPQDSIAKAIDHTLLKQDGPSDAYEKLFAQARTWNTFSVCIPPNRVPMAASVLEDSDVLVCTVVGFPFGYDSTAAKIAETQWCVNQGAEEIDMVIPVGFVKDDNLAYVFQDIQAVVHAADKKLVKVILETSELTPLEIVRASTLACFAGCHFLKTSTGFASGGATLDALHIMRKIGGENRGVKASGGVRTREFALQCLTLGVDRIGASSTGAILGVQETDSGGY